MWIPILSEVKTLSTKQKVEVLRHGLKTLDIAVTSTPGCWATISALENCSFEALLKKININCNQAENCYSIEDRGAVFN